MTIFISNSESYSSNFSSPPTKKKEKEKKLFQALLCFILISSYLLITCKIAYGLHINFYLQHTFKVLVVFVLAKWGRIIWLRYLRLVLVISYILPLLVVEHSKVPIDDACLQHVFSQFHLFWFLTIISCLSHVYRDAFLNIASFGFTRTSCPTDFLPYRFSLLLSYQK